MISKLLSLMGLRDHSNLIDIEKGAVWTLRQVLCLMAFVGVFSGLPLVLIRYLGYFLTGNDFYLYRMNAYIMIGTTDIPH